MPARPFAQAIKFRATHRNSLPAPPRGFPLRQLKEMYQTACNDFDRTKAKSNAARVTLKQWSQLCAAGELPTKRFTPAAAAVTFAMARRGAEEDLSLEQFVSALAMLAEQTGRSFESVVSLAATCPLYAEQTAPKTPGAAPRTPGPGARPKTPGAAPKTPGAAPTTPGAAGGLRAGRVLSDAVNNSVSGGALESVLTEASEALFAKYDVDADGLLSSEEITSLVMSGVAQGNQAGRSHMYLSTGVRTFCVSTLYTKYLIVLVNYV